MKNSSLQNDVSVTTINCHAQGG